MSLAWGERKRLLRLTGVAEELLDLASGLHDDETATGIRRQLAHVMSEVHGVLSEGDTGLANEFDRVLARADDTIPNAVRAATLAGWLKASAAVEAMDEQRSDRAQDEFQEARKRRVSIGFKLRPSAGDKG